MVSRETLTLLRRVCNSSARAAQLQRVRHHPNDAGARLIIESSERCKLGNRRGVSLLTSASANHRSPRLSAATTR